MIKERVKRRVRGDKRIPSTLMGVVSFLIQPLLLRFASATKHHLLLCTCTHQAVVAMEELAPPLDLLHGDGNADGDLQIIRDVLSINHVPIVASLHSDKL